jgi:hypothetical protein
MQMKIRNRIRLSKSLIMLVIFALIMTGFGTASAAPDPLDPLFATTTGIDITCSQSYPCNLPTAVALAADNQYVYVAAGTYTGVMDPMLPITKDIRLIGGWDGAPSGEVVIDPVANLTVLEGEDARRVIEIVDMATPIISGFTIQHGYHNVSGAAIYVDDSPLLQVLDTIFYDNYADSYGGGLYVNQGTIEVKRCLFDSNQVVYGGGGVMLAIGVNATMVDNTFTGNSASYGSAIHLDRAFVNFYNNYVVDNLGSTSGGAISINGTVGVEISFFNNIIAGNVGDGIDVHKNTLNLYHNTIADNGYSGLVIDTDAHVALMNNIFSGHDGSFGQSIEKDESGVIDSSTNNLFWNNTSDPYVGTNSLYGDPKFIGVYHLLPDSAARHQGANSVINWDIDHQARANGAAPDIGADEAYPLFLPLVLR